MSKWIDIGSDVNWREYGGRWARKVGPATYHVIRFDNMQECCGEPGYHCDLQEVDIESDRLAEALECIGCDHDGLDDYGRPIESFDLVKCEALSSYGAYAPLWQQAGMNAHSLIREAKRESRKLASDPDAYAARMDRPVNGLGATAREYQAGYMLSAVLRGVERGDPKAELMLKLGVR